jgi:hypothetical protein
MQHHVTRIETDYYLAQLHACFVVWLDTMTLLQRVAMDTLTREEIIAMSEPVAQAHRDLAQRTVAPPMLAVHQAARDLLQSAMDAVDAVAAGRGKPAVRDMSEQLTIFQAELVLFAERAGFALEKER